MNEKYSSQYNNWSDGYPPDWQNRRKKALLRDNHRCQDCGDKSVPENNVRLDVDHVIPKSDGGSHSLSNLQTLCRQCHAAKHPGNKKLARRADDSPHLIVVLFIRFAEFMLGSEEQKEDSIEVHDICNISTVHQRAHLNAEVDQLWDPNSNKMQQVGLLRKGDEVIKFVSWKGNEVKRLKKGNRYHIEYASVEEYKGKYDRDVELELDTYTEVEPS